MAKNHPRRAAALKIVSGGQTGVDRAALDAAMASGLAVGGWCPKGRRAMDGIIPLHYPLRETDSGDYAVRTARNVRDADATLVLAYGKLTGGTRLTAQCAARFGRPLYIVNLHRPPSAERVIAWLRSHCIAVLNVAGPREEGHPGSYAAARAFLSRVLRVLLGV